MNDMSLILGSIEALTLTLTLTLIVRFNDMTTLGAEVTSLNEESHRGHNPNP